MDAVGGRGRLGVVFATAVLLAMSGAGPGRHASAQERTFRLADAAEDEAWKALEAEQERRRRARQPPAAAEPAPRAEQPRGQVGRSPAPAPTPAKPARRPERPKREARPAAPEPRPAVRRPAPAPQVARPRHVPEERARPVQERRPAPVAARPAATSRAAECYRSVGIQTDASGRPLRDVGALSDERSQEAFIRCVDGR